jgi:hypothetical protein
MADGTFSCFAYSSTLRMRAICSSEMWGSEGNVLHSHRQPQSAQSQHDRGRFRSLVSLMLVGVPHMNLRWQHLPWQFEGTAALRARAAHNRYVCPHVGRFWCKASAATYSAAKNQLAQKSSKQLIRLPSIESIRNQHTHPHKSRLDLIFSQRWLWGALHKFSDVSEEHNAFIFRVDHMLSRKQARSNQKTKCLFSISSTLKTAALC